MTILDTRPWPPTTAGTIALRNLQARLDGLEAQAAAGSLTLAQGAARVDMLTLRGHLLGRIVDYEQAAAIAETLVSQAPAEVIACMARARARATLHRFAGALADLEVAESLGADPSELAAERAAIFQALGFYDAALALRQAAVERQPDFTSLSGLAGLQAERGEVAEAERLFDQGQRHYQGVSPFPLALLDFQRALMWLGKGDLGAARHWLVTALRRVPAFAPARGHLAEVDAALGERAGATAALRPLAEHCDDPEYAGLLAGLLSEAGEEQEAAAWRARAAARYDELVALHPEAFADHAAEFWLAAGTNPARALQLARQNLVARSTPRAIDLLERATLSSRSSVDEVR